MLLPHQERNGPDALPIQARDEPAPKEADDPFQIDLSLALTQARPPNCPTACQLCRLDAVTAHAFLQWAANPLKPR